MAGYNIGAVAKSAGLNASAIRYYEQEGLIPAAARISGRRVYNDEIFDHLTIVALAQAAGFSINEIRRLKRGLTRRCAPGERWRELATKKMAELEAQIAAAQRMKSVLRALTRCDCPTLADCAQAARALET